MQTEELKDLAITALEDLKAVELKTLDVHEMTTVTDWMVIASGTSDRHVKSLAAAGARLLQPREALEQRRIGPRPRGLSAHPADRRRAEDAGLGRRGLGDIRQAHAT
jgi:hypothetical protein